MKLVALLATFVPTSRCSPTCSLWDKFLRFHSSYFLWKTSIFDALLVSHQNDESNASENFDQRSIFTFWEYCRVLLLKEYIENLWRSPFLRKLNLRKLIGKTSGWTKWACKFIEYFHRWISCHHSTKQRIRICLTQYWPKVSRYSPLESLFYYSYFLLDTVVRKCSVKKVFIKISQNSKENMCQSYLFNKVAGLVGLQLYEKEALTQVFSCEFCEIFKNTFSITAC